MDAEYKQFLFGELREHVSGLQEASETERPDSEKVAYHFQKANQIIDKLEKIN